MSKDLKDLMEDLYEIKQEDVNRVAAKYHSRVAIPEDLEMSMVIPLDRNILITQDANDKPLVRYHIICQPDEHLKKVQEFLGSIEFEYNADTASLFIRVPTPEME